MFELIEYLAHLSHSGRALSPLNLPMTPSNNALASGMWISIDGSQR